jgi:endo-1,4-beta-xylanase
VRGSRRCMGLRQPKPPLLRDTAQRKNLLVGSAVSHREFQQPAFTELCADQASIVVPEKEIKWHVIHPEPDRFDFARADALVSFALQHGQKLRGHNLCWHNQIPSWFAKPPTPSNAGDLLPRHIAEVAGTLLATSIPGIS